MNMTDTSAFRKMWDLGYTRLVPIIPPGSPISDGSYLKDRPASVGKVPGVRYASGTWGGVKDWQKLEATDNDLVNWHQMGAGVGLKLGQGLVAIDSDTEDQSWADTITHVVEEHFGDLPVRFGNAPKAAYLLRVSDADNPTRFTKVSFAHGHVELLVEGKQIVVDGIHPKTKRPYTWPRGVPRRDELPEVTPDQLAAFFADLKSKLPAATEYSTKTSADRGRDQRELVGDPKDIKAAINALPNVDEAVSHDEYVLVGCALKASLPDNEELANELWHQWAARWVPVTANGRGYSYGEAQREWDSFKPPFGVGADFLYALAAKYGTSGYERPPRPVLHLFEDIVENPFDQAPKEDKPPTAEIEWIDPIKWEGVEPKPREWLVEGWIPAGEVTLLTGNGGVGKTLLVHQLLTAVALGGTWLGFNVPKGRAMGFFCEDSPDELHRRQADINRSFACAMSDLTHDLRLTSRQHGVNVLVEWVKDGVKRHPIYLALVRDIKAFKPTLLVLDTVADLYGGSEIDRYQVNYFIKAVLGEIVRDTGCTILLLGHPSKAGLSEGSGLSGSTAWNNAVRSRLYVELKDKKVLSSDRILKVEKSNYAPAGSAMQLRWERGVFGVVAASSASGARAAADAVVPTLAQHIDKAVVEALADIAESKTLITMSEKPRAGNYAPKVIKTKGGERMKEHSVEDIRESLDRLTAQGKIKLAAVQAMKDGRDALAYVIVQPSVFD